MNYTWLFFDLDNTLLDFNASSKSAFFTYFDKTDLGLGLEDYDRYRVINHQVWVELELGKISFEELKSKRWQVFSDEKRLNLNPLEVNNFYFNHIASNPIYIQGAEALISKLIGKYKLAIITNGLPEVQIPRLSKTGLDKIFDPIVISKSIGYAKPDGAFFDYAYNKAGKPYKEDVLVIGDSLNSDIRGGIQYGFDTCWYNYYAEDNKSEYHATHEVTSMMELESLLII